MPIIQKLNWFEDLKIGIWQLEEEAHFFLKNLDLSPEEEKQLQKIKGRRKLEWLGGRWLVHLLSGSKERIACTLDEFGKPHLQKEKTEISISHSHGLIAVALAPVKCGIDIQKQVSKIHRIAKKFMRPEEMEALESPDHLGHLHVYWGIKESLFKAYGRKQVDFKQHLFLDAFNYNPKTIFNARISKETVSETYQATFDLLQGNFILTAVREKEHK